ncbi:MAG: hypothetical protein ACTHLR_17465 [Rhizomicrobium sp.]
MSETIPAEIADELSRSDRSTYFEQRIFTLSPFGIFGTAALIFLSMFGLYVFAAVMSHDSILLESGGRMAISSGARMALILSLLLAVIPSVQRYVRLSERANVLGFARVLRGGLAQALDITRQIQKDARLGRASLLGLIFGFFTVAAIYFAFAAHGDAGAALGPKLWFGGVTVLLCISFARGVELSRASALRTNRAIERDLIIDLLRIELLDVWGRTAAQIALIWFTVSAVACLLFLSSEINLLTVLFLLSCIGMGLWVFVATMSRIHRKIRAVKQAELDRIRCEIDVARTKLADSADAALRIPGLLAYEARIAEVAEWPFDQTTLVRVGASSLIVTVPWFGQAVAQYFIEHLAH